MKKAGKSMQNRKQNNRKNWRQNIAGVEQENTKTGMRQYPLKVTLDKEQKPILFHGPLLNKLLEMLKAGKLIMTVQSRLRIYFRGVSRKLLADSQRFRKMSPKSGEISMRAWKMASGATIAVLVMSGSLLYFANDASAAYIVVDGQTIGMVESVPAGKSLVQAVLQEAGQEVGQTAKTDHKVDVRSAWVPAGTMPNMMLSSAELKSVLTPYLDGYDIKVAGTEVAEVPTLLDAVEVLLDLKDYYAQPGDSKTISSVTFAENVATEQTKVQPEKMETPAQALALLERGKEIDNEYTVRKGDSLWLIARKNDMLTQEVLNGNPGLNEKSTIKPGKGLGLFLSSPMLM